MTWLTTLYKTYDELEKLNDTLPFEQQVMPICHTLQNAHIHIVINNQGEFVRAEVLEKAQVVLPATEQSAGRSSGLCAHALADKIQYVAKDYPDFGGAKKSGFELYHEQLKAWCDSEHGHSAVSAVYQYIAKGTVVADLIAEKVLHTQDGQLLTKWHDEGETPALLKILPKEKGLFDQGSALVCWSVEIPGDPQSKTWLDPSIQQSWIAFDSQNGESSALCYATGEDKLVASNHPAKIRHSGDKAKLISANDKSGYTFRGRFLSNEEACNISFEVTQKAHNALRCLLTKQSVFRNGDQVYLAWAISGKEVPKSTELDFNDFASFLDETDSVDHTQDLGRAYANQLKRYFNGIKTKNQLEDNDQIAYAYDLKVRPLAFNSEMGMVMVDLALRARPPVRPEPLPSPKLVIAYPSGSVASNSAAAIARMWTEIGVETTTRELKRGETIPPDDNWDFLYLEVTMEEPLVDASNVIGPEGIATMVSAPIEQTLRNLSYARSWQRACADLRRLHRQTAVDLSVVPLYQVREYFAYRDTVRAIGRDLIHLYQNVDRWKIDLTAEKEEQEK